MFNFHIKEYIKSEFWQFLGLTSHLVEVIPEKTWPDIIQKQTMLMKNLKFNGLDSGSLLLLLLLKRRLRKPKGTKERLPVPSLLLLLLWLFDKNFRMSINQSS